MVVSILALCAVFANDEVVTSADQDWEAVLTGAQAGDVIVLQAGTYDLDRRVDLRASGRADAPIIVRAEAPGAVRLESTTVEAFKVSGAHWHFEDLDVVGVCAKDHDCEHAFHVVGDADGFVLKNSRVLNFNAQIKANRENGEFPDGALIIGNEFGNDAPRQTSRPVVPIDVVGADRWVVEANYFHDFQKAGGNGISYAAFFKGNSRQGVFRRNLVVCEADHTGGTRLGLSFGGGGSSPDSICRGSDCSIEHTGGVMENNIIANCPASLGIYLNKSKNTTIAYNTLYDTVGVDARFSVTTARLTGNLIDGRLKERDGGTIEVDGRDFTGLDLSTVYDDPAGGVFTVRDGSGVEMPASADAPEGDFCDQARATPTTAGAVDAGSDCDTTAIVVEGDDDPGAGGPGDTDDTADDGANDGSEDGLDSEIPVDPAFNQRRSVGCSTVGEKRSWNPMLWVAIFLPIWVNCLILPAISRSRKDSE